MTTKRDRVARLLRARIERGEFEDGHHLVQRKLAAEYGVHRDVVCQALSALENEALVSQVAGRYRVNATYTTRLLQQVLARLWRAERQTWARR